MKDLPIACTLPPEALRKRRDELLPALAVQALERTNLPEGILLRLAPSSEALMAIARAIDAERECCRFLRFRLTIEEGAGPFTLEVTGAPGTRVFLDELMGTTVGTPAP